MSRTRSRFSSRFLCGMALAASLIASAPARAAEGDELRFSLTTRAWFANWTSWFPTDSGADGNNDLIQTETADQKISVIPGVSASYGKFFATVSALPKTSFDFKLPATGSRITAERSELDINAGYYLIPGLAASIGYKGIDQDFPGQQLSWRGPILGVSGSIPLSDGWAFYGNFAVGFFKADGITDEKLNARYFIAEPGVAYVLPFDGYVKTLAFSLGYRVQSVQTDNLPLQFRDTTVYDITQGANFGVTAGF